MQRGILTLNVEEVSDITHRLPIEQYAETPLVNKLMSAIQQKEGDVNIEVSEEELEIILDEMGIPNPETDTDFTRSARSKINALMMKFRESHY